jgi:hypothetical protein
MSFSISFFGTEQFSELKTLCITKYSKKFPSVFSSNGATLINAKHPSFYLSINYAIISTVPYAFFTVEWSTNNATKSSTKSYSNIAAYFFAFEITVCYAVIATNFSEF